MISGPVPKVTAGEVWIFLKYLSIFTLRESRVMLHLLCWQGFAVPKYGFTLAAADLQHPRLLQHRGKVGSTRYSL
jgi:hypothetical protein